jgi:hypothetical protein
MAPRRPFRFGSPATGPFLEHILIGTMVNPGRSTETQGSFFVENPKLKRFRYLHKQQRETKFGMSVRACRAAVISFEAPHLQ